MSESHFSQGLQIPPGTTPEGLNKCKKSGKQKRLLLCDFLCALAQILLKEGISRPRSK